nr:hypothetical protein GCM10020093_063300 [Planobispora longispora]
MGSTRERLVPPMPGNVLWGWLGPLLVAAFGAVLRFADLGRPHAVMFDETYYAKDALALITFGVERKAFGSVEDPVADRMLIAGDTRIWETCVPPDSGACPCTWPTLRWASG